MAARTTRRDSPNGMAVGAGGACAARNVHFAGSYAVVEVTREIDAIDLGCCKRFFESHCQRFDHGR